jgi:DNA mismatch repair protein MutS
MALLKEYFKLIDEYREKLGKNTILLMEVGSFYEVYTKVPSTKEITEPQVIDLRKFTDLATGKKTDDVLMLGFSSKIPFLLEKYLEKIITNGYTVVVYNQDAPINNTTRSLKGIFSPGTYFYENNNDDEVSNHLSCIWIEKYKKTKLNNLCNVVIGMSVIDNYTGKSSLYQIIVEDLHNPTTYDELERFISSYNPKECIIISNFSDKEIKDIIQFIKLDSKKIHILNTLDSKVKKSEGQSYQREILDKFFSFNIAESLFKNSL